MFVTSLDLNLSHQMYKWSFILCFGYSSSNGVALQGIQSLCNYPMVFQKYLFFQKSFEVSKPLTRLFRRVKTSSKHRYKAVVNAIGVKSQLCLWKRWIVGHHVPVYPDCYLLCLQITFVYDLSYTKLCEVWELIWPSVKLWGVKCPSVHQLALCMSKTVSISVPQVWSNATTSEDERCHLLKKLCNGWGRKGVTSVSQSHFRTPVLKEMKYSLLV